MEELYTTYTTMEIRHRLLVVPARHCHSSCCLTSRIATSEWIQRNFRIHHIGFVDHLDSRFHPHCCPLEQSRRKGLERLVKARRQCSMQSRTCWIEYAATSRCCFRKERKMSSFHFMNGLFVCCQDTVWVFLPLDVLRNERSY
jgi:hypothetical protein